MPFLLLAMRATSLRSLLQNFSHVTSFNPSAIVDELLNCDKPNFQLIRGSTYKKEIFFHPSFFQNLGFYTKKGAIGQVTCVYETKLTNISSKRSIF